MLPRQLELDKVADFSKYLPCYYTSIQLLDGFNTQHARYIKGAITEMLIENLLSRTYGEEKVYWDAENVQEQMHGKLNGRSDGGFDIKLIDSGIKIDVKLDSNLINDQVSLNLFNSYGYKHLLLSGNADCSVHVLCTRRRLSRVQKYVLKMQEFQLKILYIDLNLLRSDLKIENGKYSLEKYTENVLAFGDRALKFPVKFLVDRGYARLDVYNS